jgi:hypothetical protein
MQVNLKMIPVETIPGVSSGWGEFKYDIYDLL